MACTLAESPSDPLHRKLRQLRCLRCRFDCYRVERTSSRAGVAPAEVQRLSRRTVTPAAVSQSAFIDNLQKILRVFSCCTAPGTKSAIVATPTEHQLRSRPGFQSLPTARIHDSPPNKRPCIQPSTLAARPISSEVRGRQRFLCPEWFPELVTISLFACSAATEQKARQREHTRWRLSQWQPNLC